MKKLKLGNAEVNEWVETQGTILNRVIREDNSEEVTFNQKADWMSYMVKWGKNVQGRRMCKCKCTKVENN